MHHNIEQLLDLRDFYCLTYLPPITPPPSVQKILRKFLWDKKYGYRFHESCSSYRWHGWGIALTHVHSECVGPALTFPTCTDNLLTILTLDILDFCLTCEEEWALWQPADLSLPKKIRSLSWSQLWHLQLCNCACVPQTNSTLWPCAHFCMDPALSRSTAGSGSPGWWDHYWSLVRAAFLVIRKRSDPQVNDTLPARPT